jgi:hypothetical protein
MFSGKVSNVCTTSGTRRVWYLRFTDSVYLIGFLNLRILITSLVSSIYGFWLPHWYLRFTDSDYLIGILDLRLLITSLVS